MRSRGCWGVWGAAAIGASVAIGCLGEQALHDDCPTANGACPGCQSDADCVIVTNECHPSATCTDRHRSPLLATNSIGCDRTYDVPPPERCGCVSGVCRAR